MSISNFVQSFHTVNDKYKINEQKLILNFLKFYEDNIAWNKIKIRFKNICHQEFSAIRTKCEIQLRFKFLIRIGKL